MQEEHPQFGGVVGWVRAVDRPVIIQNQPPAVGLTTTTVAMRGVIHPVRDFWFTYRTAANWLTARNWYNFSDITSWSMTGHNRDIVSSRTHVFQLFQYNRTHSSLSSKEEIPSIYYHTWSDRPMNSRDDYGFFHHETINNVEIIIVGHPVAVANDRLDFYFQTRSLMLISPNGGISMIIK
jgi:hypothetical protein